MDTNEFRRNKISSSSESSSDQDAQDDPIFADDTPSLTKVIAKQNKSDQTKSLTSAPVVIIFPNQEAILQTANNELRSQSGKSSEISSKVRPSIYDQMEMNQDNYRYRERQQIDYRQKRNQKLHISYFDKEKYQNNQKNYRKNNNQHYRNNYPQHHQKRYQYHQYNQDRPSYPNRQYQYNNRQNYRNQPNKYNPSNNQRQFWGHSKKYEGNRRNQKFEDQDFRANQNGRPFIEQKQRQQNIIREQRKKQSRESQKQNDNRKDIERGKYFQMNKQEKKKSQKQARPQSSIESNKQQSVLLQNKSKHTSNETSKNDSINLACSNIEIENTEQNHNKRPLEDKHKKNLSSDWNSSGQQQPVSQDQNRSTFQCHQISLDLPLPPAISQYQVDEHDQQGDKSLLEGLKALLYNRSDKRDSNLQQNLELNLKQQEQKRKNMLQLVMEQNGDKFLNEKQLEILLKMFDHIPVEEQNVFVELQINTSNVFSYKLKKISSQIFDIQCSVTQQLKSPFILVREFQKIVPRDRQPAIQNMVPTKNQIQNIDYKKTKIVLAQIKNILGLLQHRDKFTGGQFTEEQKIISKIQASKLKLIDVDNLIAIDEITLRCSSCRNKKTFIWNDQIHPNQCGVSCSNYLRFEITKMYIC